MNKPLMGRPPKKDKDRKKATSIRLTDSIRKRLIKKFGGVQKALDILITEFLTRGK